MTTARREYRLWKHHLSPCYDGRDGRTTERSDPPHNQLPRQPTSRSHPRLVESHLFLRHINQARLSGLLAEPPCPSSLEDLLSRLCLCSGTAGRIHLRDTSYHRATSQEWRDRLDPYLACWSLTRMEEVRLPYLDDPGAPGRRPTDCLHLSVNLSEYVEMAE